MSKNQTFFIRLLVISILFFPLSIKSFSQSLTLKEIEKDLSDTYSKIFPFYYGNHDSLDFYSSLFSDKMHKYIGEYPSTLNYPFQSLIDSNDCTIVTSKDRLFRIYSWDTWLGGTMHFFENIYQYGSGNRAFSKT